MNNRKSYAGVDLFRPLAALLVVAIHTAPLAGIHEGLEFVFTHIWARVAVPFFLMVTGFFLLGGSSQPGRISSFWRKNAMLYLAGILLCLPVNLYNGYFQTASLPSLLRDLLIDGTFYHLWYFPALLTGIWLADRLKRRWGLRRALLISLLLYLTGLLGDSYYGLARSIPPLHWLYGQLFQCFDYTRNGLFLAPVFLLLGASFGERGCHPSPRRCLAGLIVSLVGMTAEGLVLRRLVLQRHDSMYLLLPVVMYFLFGALLQVKGEARPALRAFSTVVYLIHPLAIIAVRSAGRMFGLERLLIGNRLCHFFAVCLLSGIAGAACLLGRTYFMGRRGRFPCPAYRRGTDRAWIELDLDRLGENLAALQREMQPDCRMMAVVKADAYGHGALAIAQELSRLGVGAFAVATIDEGIALRRDGIVGDILILGYTVPSRAREIWRWRLTQTVTDPAYAQELNRFSYPLRVHLKIDTGMHRLGIDFQSPEAVAELFRLEHLKIDGIFTHLCSCDSLSPEDMDYTGGQLQHFFGLLDGLKALGIRLPSVHVQSSYGLLNYPQLHCDYVRVGIALYGVHSAPGIVSKRQPELFPVLSLKARVVLVREIPKGDTVGYSRMFTTQRDTRLAVLSIGYADGYPRELSCGNGYVLLHGKYAPIVGRICMDQLTVDVTDIPQVSPGDIATLIGRDGDEEITAPQLAAAAGTISNELLSRLGSRLERVVL